MGDPNRPPEIQPAPRILTFDGGGVRGLSSLLILRDLLEEVQRKTDAKETPKPCEYFDLIGGTSTGGLIAIMLGRLGMTVQECIDTYLEMSKKVFKLDKVFLGKIPVGDYKCRFDYADLETVIKAIIKKRVGDEDCPMPVTNQPCCHTFVVAKIAGSIDGPPVLFRSYNAEGVGASKCAMWKAARATSAAPTFFKPIKIEPSPAVTYVDGGLGYNNPSQLAQAEAKRIWPTAKTSCLVSIGTGRPSSVRIAVDPEKLERDTESQRNILEYISSFIPDIVSWVPLGREARDFPKGVVAVIKMANTMARLVTNSEEVHRYLQVAAYASDAQFQYYRFNVPREVGDIGLGDWAKAEEMAAHTAAYLGEPGPMERKNKCARALLIGPIAPHTPTRNSRYDDSPLIICEGGPERPRIVSLPTLVPETNEIAAWTKMVDEEPNEHLWQRKLADAYLEKGDVNDAIEGWKGLVDKHPDEWKLQTQLSNVLGRKGTIQKASRWWPKYAARAPALSAQIIEQEIQIWRELVTNHPKALGLQIQLEKAFRKKENLDEEVEVWASLVDKHPEEWKLQTELAQAYSKKRATDLPNEDDVSKLDDEISGWRGLVKKHPEEWELQVRLADAYSRKSKMEEVVRILRKVKARNKGTAEEKAVNMLKGSLSRRRDVTRETQDWERLVGAHPKSRGLQMQLEFAYARKGNTEMAIAGWKRLVEKYPKERDLAIQLKRAFEKGGDITEEIAGWEGLVDSHPAEWTLQTHLAEVYSKLEDDDGETEIEGWKNLLNKHPEEQELRDRLLHACIQHIRELKVALEQLKELDQEHPKNKELPALLKEMWPKVEAKRPSESS